MLYSGEDGESEEDSRLAVATAWGMRRRGSQPQPRVQTDREKIALDITILKKQYDKLRERQKQAHIILSSAVSKQQSPSGPSMSIPMNKLLIGKNAIMNKGRRFSAPKNTIPPARVTKAIKPPVKLTKQEETLHWKDTDDAKKRRNSMTWKELNAERKVEEAKISKSSSASSLTSRRDHSFSKQRSDSSSYSEEESDGDSSPSTSLCDDVGHSASSLESSPLKKRLLTEVPEGGVIKHRSKSKRHAVVKLVKQDKIVEIIKEITPEITPDATPEIAIEATETTISETTSPDTNIHLDLSASPDGDITSISQLSPMPDISSYFIGSLISPIKTPSTVFEYTKEFNSLGSTSDQEDDKFKVSDEGVTNEFFERITSTTPLNYSSENVIETTAKMTQSYSLTELPVTILSPNAPSTSTTSCISPDILPSIHENICDNILVSEELVEVPRFVKLKSFSLDDTIKDKDEVILINRSYSDGTIINDDEKNNDVKRIIAENSNILQNLSTITPEADDLSLLEMITTKIVIETTLDDQMTINDHSKAEEILSIIDVIIEEAEEAIEEIEEMKSKAIILPEDIPKIIISATSIDEEDEVLSDYEPYILPVIEDFQISSYTPRNHSPYEELEMIPEETFPSLTEEIQEIQAELLHNQKVIKVSNETIQKEKKIKDEIYELNIKSEKLPELKTSIENQSNEDNTEVLSIKLKDNDEFKYLEFDDSPETAATTTTTVFSEKSIIHPYENVSTLETNLPNKLVEITSATITDVLLSCEKSLELVIIESPTKPIEKCDSPKFGEIQLMVNKLKEEMENPLPLSEKNAATTMQNIEVKNDENDNKTLPEQILVNKKPAEKENVCVTQKENEEEKQKINAVKFEDIKKSKELIKCESSIAQTSSKTEILLHKHEPRKSNILELDTTHDLEVTKSNSLEKPKAIENNVEKKENSSTQVVEKNHPLVTQENSIVQVLDEQLKEKSIVKSLNQSADKSKSPVYKEQRPEDIINELIALKTSPKPTNKLENIKTNEKPFSHELEKLGTIPKASAEIIQKIDKTSSDEIIEKLNSQLEKCQKPKGKVENHLEIGKDEELIKRTIDKNTESEQKLYITEKEVCVNIESKKTVPENIEKEMSKVKNSLEVSIDKLKMYDPYVNRDTHEVLEQLNSKLETSSKKLDYEKELEKEIVKLRCRSPSGSSKDKAAYRQSVKELEELIRERELEKLKAKKPKTYECDFESIDFKPKRSIATLKDYDDSEFIKSSGSYTNSLYTSEPKKDTKVNESFYHEPERARKPFKSSPTNNLTSSTNISGTLTSIQDTIKTLDNVCPRKDGFNTTRLNKAMESIDKICESDKQWHSYKKKIYESPPSLRADDILTEPRNRSRTSEYSIDDSKLSLDRSPRDKSRPRTPDYLLDDSKLSLDRSSREKARPRTPDYLFDDSKLSLDRSSREMSRTPDYLMDDSKLSLQRSSREKARSRSPDYLLEDSKLSLDRLSRERNKPRTPNYSLDDSKLHLERDRRTPDYSVNDSKLYIDKSFKNRSRSRTPDYLMNDSKLSFNRDRNKSRTPDYTFDDTKLHLDSLPKERSRPRTPDYTLDDSKLYINSLPKERSRPRTPDYTLNDSKLSIDQSSREKSRDISPRRKRFDDYDDTDYRTPRDPSPRISIKMENSLDTYKKDSDKSHLSKSKTHLSTDEYISGRKSPCSPSLNHSEKTDIRQSSVTSTFYDRYQHYKCEQMSPTSPIMSRSYMTPKSPRSPSYGLNLSSSLNTPLSPNEYRTSKSAETSPCRYPNEITTKKYLPIRTPTDFKTGSWSNISGNDKSFRDDLDQPIRSKTSNNRRDYQYQDR